MIRAGKLHLLRHTAASQDEQHTTTLGQRQAVLRMLTGDYCGIGYPFTVNGHPLRYTFAQPWEPRYPALFGDQVKVVAIDALWDPSGARCIGTPRLGAEHRGEIEARCGHTLDDCAVLAEAPPAQVRDSASSAVVTVSTLIGPAASYALSANP